MAKKVVEKKNTKKVEKKTEVVKTDVAKKKPSKNLITAIIIAAVAILFIVLSFVISKEPEKVEYTLKEMDVSSASKTIQDWYNDLASGDTVVSVLASSNCQFCQALKPVITSAAEKWARENGVHKLEAEVFHKNVRSLGNLIKNGYTIVGIKREAAIVDKKWMHIYVLEKILDE